ncbi:MAG: Gx transporter family protein [Oscillospiraceae bacterium]|nr:Gx transporter family protein [Oscillospiraceae bacterium]
MFCRGKLPKLATHNQSEGNQLSTVNGQWSTAKRAALLGLFAALAAALSAFEGALPPLPFLPPGAKAGLSNIAVLVAAGELGFSGALSVALFKGATAFFTRGAVAGLMSLSGGLVSAFIMTVAAKNGRFGFVGVGLWGALFHNLAQLAVAWLLIGRAVFYYLPVFMLLSLCTGSVTGLVAGLTVSAMRTIKN